MKHFIPSISDLELAIDRAYRIPKLDFLPASVPRDVLARLHKSKNHVCGKIRTTPSNFVRRHQIIRQPIKSNLIQQEKAGFCYHSPMQ